MSGEYYDNNGGEPYYHDSGTGSYHHGSGPGAGPGAGAGPGGNGQTMGGNGYGNGYGIGLGGDGQTIGGNGYGNGYGYGYGYGYGIGLGGPEPQYAPGDANSASFAPAYGGGHGQHQPPMYPQGYFQQPPVQQHPLPFFLYPSAAHGYGSQLEWQPGQQNRGGGESVQKGPGVKTGQEWCGRRRVEISDQEDLPPFMNVKQIPQPSRLSTNTNKSRSSSNRQDSRQNRWPGVEMGRYGMGVGHSRSEPFSQEERTNV